MGDERPAKLSGVSVEFAALHFDPIMGDGWHPHTFKVTIWRDASGAWTDGRSPRAGLQQLIDVLAPEDPETTTRRLPEHLWSNEAIAEACLVLANAVKVDVDRDGFLVEFWAR